MTEIFSPDDKKRSYIKSEVDRMDTDLRGLILHVNGNRLALSGFLVALLGVGILQGGSSSYFVSHQIMLLGVALLLVLLAVLGQLWLGEASVVSLQMARHRFLLNYQFEPMDDDTKTQVAKYESYEKHGFNSQNSYFVDGVCNTLLSTAMVLIMVVVVSVLATFI